MGKAFQEMIHELSASSLLLMAWENGEFIKFKSTVIPVFSLGKLVINLLSPPVSWLKIKAKYKSDQAFSLEKSEDKRVTIGCLTIFYTGEEEARILLGHRKSLTVDGLHLVREGG